MKKLFTLSLFLLLAAGASAQSFEGFFKPVPNDIVATSKAMGTNTWLFRPVVALTAMQFNLTNPVEVAALSSLGTGLSLVRFTEQNGEPYAQFGVNALILFSANPGGVELTKLSLAATITALQYVNVGAGYTFADKRFFILTGVTINFN
jgi:hypothetical protein